jgi:transposase-like protein
MRLHRGVAVDHTTIFRWKQAYAVGWEKRLRRHRGPDTGYRRGATYIGVKGVTRPLRAAALVTALKAMHPAPFRNVSLKPLSQ